MISTASLTRRQSWFERLRARGAAGLSDYAIAAIGEQLAGDPAKLRVVVDDEHGAPHQPSMPANGATAHQANPTSRAPPLDDTLGGEHSRLRAYALDVAAEVLSCARPSSGSWKSKP